MNENISSNERKPSNAKQIRESWLISKQEKTVFTESNETTDDITSNQRHEWTMKALKDQMLEKLRAPLLRLRKSDSLLNDMKKNIPIDFSFCFDIEVNHLFLWSAMLGNITYMKNLLEQGADIACTSEDGTLNALHLAALSGSLQCCSWLLANGCPMMMDVKLTSIHYAVSGGSKEILQYFMQCGYHVSSTVIVSATLANAIDCLELLLMMELNVNVYLDDTTALHVAAEIGNFQSMKLILNHESIDVNLKTIEKRYTALHLAAENGYIDCVELLISKNCRIDEVDRKLQTPLHLACKMKCLSCVELLLKNNASVNAIDIDGKTPLHNTVSESKQTLAVMKKLIEWKADINVADRYGYTPIHNATINELEDCTIFLILKGANLTIETKAGVTPLSIISRKIPSVLEAVPDRLTQFLAYNKEQNLKFNFRELLIYSTVGEIGYLYALQKQCGNSILKHPLCRAFLYFKWQKVKSYYLLKLFFEFITVCMISSYIYFQARNNAQSNNSTKCGGEPITYDCPSIFKELNKCHIKILKYFISFFILINAFRLLLRELAVQKRNLTSIRIFEITMTFIVLLFFLTEMNYRNTNWKKAIAPLLVLSSWMYLTLNIGQLPLFGTYITMFQKVFLEFLKLLPAYLCVLIGFATTFCVLLPNHKLFQEPISGFAKIVVMMAGEIDLNNDIVNINSEKNILDLPAFAVLIIFVVLVTILLMNLLIGMAVNDVEGLKNTADLTEMQQQTELIHSLESACFSKYTPKIISKYLKKFLLISPNCYRVAIYVKPLDPREKRLPKDIMKNALYLAMNKNKPKNSKSNVEQKLEYLEEKITFLTDILVKLNGNKKQYE